MLTIAFITNFCFQKRSFQQTDVFAPLFLLHPAAKEGFRRQDLSLLSSRRIKEMTSRLTKLHLTIWRDGKNRFFLTVSTMLHALETHIGSKAEGCPTDGPPKTLENS